MHLKEVLKFGQCDVAQRKHFTENVSVEPVDRRERQVLEGKMEKAQKGILLLSFQGATTTPLLVRAPKQNVGYATREMHR